MLVSNIFSHVMRLLHMVHSHLLCWLPRQCEAVVGWDIEIFLNRLGTDDLRMGFWPAIHDLNVSSGATCKEDGV